MGSFDEKVKGAPVVEIEVGKITVVKLMYMGVCVKQDVVSISNLEWTPTDNTKTKVKYQNLNHLLSEIN